MSKAVLVTGGAGYVGREVVSRLLADGDVDVHVLDNFSSGLDRLRQIDLARVTCHLADITEGAAVKRVCEAVKPAVSFHLAAIHYIPACEADPGRAAAVNVAGTVNLMASVPEGANQTWIGLGCLLANHERRRITFQQSLGDASLRHAASLIAAMTLRLTLLKKR